MYIFLYIPLYIGLSTLLRFIQDLYNLYKTYNFQFFTLIRLYTLREREKGMDEEFSRIYT